MGGLADISYPYDFVSSIISFRKHLFYPPSTTESILILQDPSKPTRKPTVRPRPPRPSRKPTKKPIEFEAIEAEGDDVDASVLNGAEETDVNRVS